MSSGIGKKTFLNNLCASYGVHDIIYHPESESNNFLNKSATANNIDIEIKHIDRFTLTSDGWDCEVHISQALGYGDLIDNKKSVEDVKRYLEKSHLAWSNFEGNLLTEQVFLYLNSHRPYLG